MATAVLTNSNWVTRRAVQSRAENLVHLQFLYGPVAEVADGTTVMLTELPWGSKVIDAYYDLYTTAGASSTIQLGAFPSSNLSGSTITVGDGGDLDGLIVSVEANATTPYTRGATVAALLGKALDQTPIATGGAAFTLAADAGLPVLIGLTPVGTTMAAATVLLINLIVKYGPPSSN